MLFSVVYGGTSMDVQQIRKLRPKLRQFLKRFDDCFPRKDTRAHLPVYVSGQLSDIPQKSVEPIAVNDETSDVKKGDKTPGVQRQWCGAVGKTENCIVTVHLAYAREGFHCLLDGELFLPESWSDDRDRCRAAGIPDDMVYRPKWKIALELFDRATANGLHFDWATSDEGYRS